jgi:hypothetical protein
MDRGVVNMDFDTVAEQIIDLFLNFGFKCGVDTEFYLAEEIIEILEDNI